MGDNFHRSNDFGLDGVYLAGLFVKIFPSSELYGSCQQ